MNQECGDVFLSDQDKPNLARATVSEYIKFAQQFGEGVETLTIRGLEMLVCDMVDAYDVVFQKGPLVGGVSSVDDRKFASRLESTFGRRFQTRYLDL